MRDWSSIAVIAVMGLGIAAATAMAADPGTTAPATSLASLPTEGQAQAPRQADADRQVYRAPVRDDERPTPGNRVALRLNIDEVGISGAFVLRRSEIGAIANRRGLPSNRPGLGAGAQTSPERTAVPILFVPF